MLREFEDLFLLALAASLSLDDSAVYWCSAMVFVLVFHRGDGLRAESTRGQPSHRILMPGALLPLHPGLVDCQCLVFGTNSCSKSE